MLLRDSEFISESFRNSKMLKQEFSMTTLIL